MFRHDVIVMSVIVMSVIVMGVIVIVEAIMMIVFATAILIVMIIILDTIMTKVSVMTDHYRKICHDNDYGYCPSRDCSYDCGREYEVCYWITFFQ